MTFARKILCLLALATGACRPPIAVPPEDMPEPEIMGPAPTGRFVIDQTELTLAPGEVVQLSATLDGAGAVELVWSLAPSGASLSNNGTFTAPAEKGVYLVSAATPAGDVASSRIFVSSYLKGVITFPAWSVGDIFITARRQGAPTPELGTRIAKPGEFVIRGVQPGNYDLEAFVDVLGMGMRSDYITPKGSAYVMSFGGTGRQLGPIVLSGPPAPIAPPAPSLSEAAKGDSVIAVSWRLTSSFGDAPADFIAVTWSTDAAFSTVVGQVRTQAQRYPVLFVKGLGNGQAYYFRATSELGGLFSASSAVLGPIIPNTPSGGSVAGEIKIGLLAATGTAFAVLSDETGMPGSVSAEPITSQNVPYVVHGPAQPRVLTVLFDRNDNGLLDSNERFTVRDETVVPNGQTGIDVVVDDRERIERVYKTRLKSGATIVSRFGLAIEAASSTPLHSVAWCGALLPPTDLALQGYGADYLSYDMPVDQVDPQGQQCAIETEYANGVSTASKTFRELPMPSSTQPMTPASSTPLFSWQAISWDSPVKYRLSVSGPSGYNWYPRGLPSAATSVNFNFDGTSPTASLPSGNYTWQFSAFDADGNRSTQTQSFVVP